MGHKLFCILGETASGKTTLVERLCRETGMSQIISYATRPRRDGESNNHIFVNDDIYEEMKKNDEIAAYTQIGDFKYWSTMKQLYENNLYVVDAIGLRALEDLGLEDIDICSIYINVPFEIRMYRAMKRGDEFSTFLARVEDEAEQFITMKAHGGFDYAISNLNEDKAYTVLKHIVEVETVQN